MTVYVAHAHVQRPVSAIKLATVLEVCTTKEQRSVVCFCEQKDSMQRMFINKCFLLKVGNVYHVHWLTTGSRNVANVSLIMMMLKQICGSGRDNSQNTSMLLVSMHW
jgi:hypothetical protein